jgi:hypothetical protein
LIDSPWISLNNNDTLLSLNDSGMLSLSFNIVSCNITNDHYELSGSLHASFLKNYVARTNDSTIDFHNGDIISYTYQITDAERQPVIDEESPYYFLDQ